MRRRWSCVTVAVIVALGAATPAGAAKLTQKKSIWGPVRVAGVAQFPIYRDLGAGIWQSSLSWRDVAQARPAAPTDPSDPAYHWPAALDDAVQQARASGIQILLQISQTPAWANGGRAANWIPSHPADLAAFATAAARRYPTVRRWMVWGEPTRQANFMPLTPERQGRRLTPGQARAPRAYARMLDATYGALKRVRASNVVIGGNSFTTGDISPLNWIREMRLPNGRRPRMDMYGHNPFTLRRPDLRQSLFRPGDADFSDLDTVWRWLDAYGYRDAHGHRLRIFISEWLLATEHANSEFNFWVTRRVQADWLTDALRIVRRTPRIATLGWYSLYDDPPNAGGDEVNRGLMESGGARKPAYAAFRDG
jgi:hypothetical protein